MQSAVLGHLPGGVGSDAIAANSVSSTFYQYLKVIVVAMSSASGVMIGKAIGAGDMKRVRSDARSMSVIDVCVGIVLGLILLAARQPLLSMYSLNERAMELAGQFMYILCFVMVGMSYQMPVSSGIIRGAGDARFSLILNLVSVWCIVMPLTFLSAFVWKWPAPAVVCVIQSDQIFKVLPIFLRFRSYKWIKKLTK
jgi:Na+-driven multidrug efflux pump